MEFITIILKIVILVSAVSGVINGILTVFAAVFEDLCEFDQHDTAWISICSFVITGISIFIFVFVANYLEA